MLLVNTSNSKYTNGYHLNFSRHFVGHVWYVLCIFKTFASAPTITIDFALSVCENIKCRHIIGNYVIIIHQAIMTYRIRSHMAHITSNLHGLCQH